MKADALSMNALRIFYGVSLVFWVIAILPLLGAVAIGELAMYSLLSYSLLSGLVFFFLLQMRSKALLRQEITRSSQMEALVSQERKRREEQAMLMTMLSHEIKTPLSVLKLVVDQKLSGSELEGHANRAVSNITLIINRCLQLGKLDAQAIPLHPSVVQINQLVSAIVRDHNASDQITIMGDPNLSAYIDEDLLKVILSNLIENSLKYALACSQIQIQFCKRMKHDKSGIALEFSNAIGPLGAPDSESVFKKFYRNRSATKVSGSGLGLFLSHELTQVLGGQITYRRESDRVIFDLWIPA
jgi:signal transduction histidine kinase